MSRQKQLYFKQQRRFQPSQELVNAYESESESSAEEKNSTDEEEGTFEVEKIMGKRMLSDGPLYLIRWKNFDANHDTWEPKSCLDGCGDMLKNFEKEFAKGSPKEHLPKITVQKESNLTRSSPKRSPQVDKRKTRNHSDVSEAENVSEKNIPKKSANSVKDKRKPNVVEKEEAISSEDDDYKASSSSASIRKRGRPKKGESVEKEKIEVPSRSSSIVTKDKHSDGDVSAQKATKKQKESEDSVAKSARKDKKEKVPEPPKILGQQAICITDDDLSKFGVVKKILQVAELPNNQRCCLLDMDNSGEPVVAAYELIKDIYPQQLINYFETTSTFIGHT